MSIPHSLVRAARHAVNTDPVLQDPAAWRSQKRPQLRRYEISALLANGNVSQTRQLAPALPLFEDAFCAFSRGSLVETENGPVAIEDILPGDRVNTTDGTSETVLWKGSTTLVPGRPGPTGRNLRLTRIMPDSFGMQRPMSYVLAGPSARLLNTPDHLRALVGGAQMLTPVQEFVDGMNVIETAPPTPVELFHICLPRHAVIRVGGLEFETYHPGANAVRMISHAMRSLYLNLFAHVDQLSGFGPLAFPRAGEGQINAMSA
jgi:Hint domain